MADSDTKNNELKQIVIKAAGISVLGIFASKIITYFFRATIARFLGPEAYGILNIGITAIGIGTTIGYLSLNNALENFIPKYIERGDQEDIKGIVLSTYQLAIPASIIGTALLFFQAEFIASTVFDSPSSANIIKIMSPTVFFSIIGFIGLDTTRGHRIQKYHTLTIKVIQPLLQLSVTLILLLLGMGLVGASIGWTVGALGTAILGFYFMEFKVGPILRTKVKPKWQRKKILKYSGPLLLSGIIGSVLGWTDTILLGQFLDETSIGLYNAALPTVALIMLPYQAMSALLLPSMSSSVEQGNRRDLEEMLESVTRWTASLTFPIFCIMLIFPEKMLHLLFGSQYTSAALALGILAIGKIFSASVGHLDTVIKSIDRSDLIFKNTLLNVGINLGLNILLIPKYGIAGAALATTLAIFFAQSLLLGEVYYFKKIHPFSKTLLKPIIASALSLLIVYSIAETLLNNSSWWVLIPAGMFFGLLYILFYSLIGIEKEDQKLIGEIYNNSLSYLPEKLQKKVKEIEDRLDFILEKLR